MNRDSKYYNVKMMLIPFFVLFSFSFSQDCPEGQVPNCNPEGGNECCSEGWIGDGMGDCEDQQWQCDLTCYECDGGDCTQDTDPNADCYEGPVEGDNCENAIDYGIVNSDTILSGTFTGTPDEDYWIKFTTTCVWRDVIISTCGSYAVDTGDGLEYLNTILEVYADTDDGDPACSQYEDWSIEFGQTPNTNWWNDDPEGEAVCDSNGESNDGEDTHAVVMIPTVEEQGAPDFEKLYPGTYYARISALPGPNSTGDWQLFITGRPEVDASVSDQSLELPHNPEDGAPGGYYSVTLDASECTCVEQVISYEWYAADTLLVGPTTEIIESVFLPYGEHSLELKITDYLEIDYTDDFTINIAEPNTPPIANAGEDIVTVIPHDGDQYTINITVQLSAELSSDDDGDNLTYQWRKIAGDVNAVLSDDTDIDPTFNAFNGFGDPPKIYEFELTTTDEYSESHIDSVMVTIYSEENDPPVASAPDLTINIFHDGDPDTYDTETFTLDGSDSYDPNGDIINFYAWFDSFMDTLALSAFSEQSILSSTDAVIGDHTYTLIVKDAYDDSDDITVTVTVEAEENADPVVAFDPYPVIFILNPDENIGGTQLVVLDAYNASYDPDNCDSTEPNTEDNGCAYDSDGDSDTYDAPYLLPEEEWTDELTFEWFEEDGVTPVSSTIQNLTQGETSFMLRATDSYGATGENWLPVIIEEPNAVPTAYCDDVDSATESTAGLDGDETTDLDVLYLYGWADDENLSELGVQWSVLTENSSITMLDDSNLEGTFYSGEVLHNDYPEIVDFSLTVWDAFSCHPLNTNLYDAENDEWNNLSCPDGEVDSTYGVDMLIMTINNYNSKPLFFEEFSVSDDFYPNIEIDEDEIKIISFDYNFWAENNFFSDVDDCDFDINASSCTGYSEESFSVSMQSGDNYFIEACLMEGIYYTESVCFIDSVADEDFLDQLSCESSNGEWFNLNQESCEGDDGEWFDENYLFLEDNFYGSIDVPFQINDKNDTNNLSDLDMLYITVNSVNDIPVITSFENDELLQEGVQEDNPFEILLEELTYYDVESCDDDGCTGISLATVVDPNYTIAPSGVVIPTQDYYGTLNLGIQITDGESVSDFFYVDIPIHGTNDPPSVIDGASPDVLQEDFGELSFDLYNIFTDVDGDLLTFVKVEEYFVCISGGMVDDSFSNQEDCEANGGEWTVLFNSEISEDSQFLDMISIDNLNGEYSVEISASDPDFYSVSHTLSFFIEAVNDPPEGVDSLYFTPTNTDSTETIDLTITIEATDVDSDSVSFSVWPDQLQNGIFPNGNIPTQTGPFSAEIVYRPDQDYRCEEIFQFLAQDYTEDLEVLSVSDTASIRIEVGACNFPPEVTVNLSSPGIPEDQEISFINNLDVGWCWDSYYEEWSQDSPENCAGEWQIDLPDYFYSLNDADLFETFDEDGDSVYLEIHEGEHYYIEGGYCAAPDPGQTDWLIDINEPCGLVAQEEACAGDILESGYADLPVYCGCLGIDICTASQLYMEQLGNKIVVRPEKDFEENFDITVVGYDNNNLYNLSEEQYISIDILPSNDPPFISNIRSQEILEDESLVLKYIYVSNLADSVNYSNDSTFVIYDSDNEEIELEFLPNPSFIYSQSWSQSDSTIIITPDENWNGVVPVTITFGDFSGGELLSEVDKEFELTVIGVEDDAEYTSAQVNGEDAIVIMEDCDDCDDAIVQIYFADIDADSTQNEDPQIPVAFQWFVSPLFGDDSNVEFIATDVYDVLQNPETGEYYFTQQILKTGLTDNWNGSDGVVLTDPNTGNDITLDVLVKQSNDVPDSFYIMLPSIDDLNVIEYDWSEDEQSICTDPILAQGTYSNGNCVISNFYSQEQWVMIADSTSNCIENDYFDSQEECMNGCDGVECESIEALYYRLPFSDTPEIESPTPDSLLFKWSSTDDIDMNPNIGNQFNDMEILYRIELIDKTNNRVLVLKDSIPESTFTQSANPELKIALSDSYFSYEYQSQKDCDENCLESPFGSIELCCNDYYDKCEHAEFTLVDTSTFNLDLDGNIMYRWRVSANNDWCDDDGLNPSRSSVTDIGVVDSFYIDITPPNASISVIQNQIAPEFMKLYISFEEEIESWRSEIFIIDASGATQSKNFPEQSSENIYTITELFPATGLVTIDIETWDQVGNGIISRKEVVYDEIVFNVSSSVQSPSGTLLIQFDENDIDKTSTILIQEEALKDEFELRSGLHRVSPAYLISSVDMNILEEIDVEILIPEYLSDIEHWKFRVRLVDSDNNPGNDITTWSKDEKVYGSLTSLESVALYYDSSAEYEIPKDIDLIGNYPNPFNPTTNIFFIVSEDNSDIRISILDILGREVRVLIDGKSDIGYYELRWDGTNDSGAQLGSGIYFINARVSGKQHYKKIMKLK